MNIQQLRNATALLTLGSHRILIDPMLSKPGSLPGFKMFGGGRRNNPLIPLPAAADQVLASVTDVLVTHEHPDHFDVPAVEWVKERRLPVWASPVDAANLRRKGLDVRKLRDGSLGMGVEVVPARHGRGFVEWLMGPVSSFYLAHPDEPSVFLTGDAVLTDVLLDVIERLRPEVVVAPAGSANFGFGPDILFSQDELITLAKCAPGKVVFNHLEALDHCPTTRSELRARMDAAGVGEKVSIPGDGESLSFAREGPAPHVKPAAVADRKPGFQKWLTARFGSLSCLC